MTPFANRLVRPVVAVVLVASLASACGGSDNQGASGNGTSTSTTTVAGESGADGGTGAERTTDPTLTPGEGTPTPPEGGTLDAPARRDDIPLAGRYTYETDINGVDGEEFFDVADAGEGEGYIRQLQIRGTDKDATSQAVVWLGNLFYAEAEQRARGGSLTQVCAWDPGLTLLELPLTVGAKWTAEATCDDPPDHPTRRRRLDIEVTGTENVTIGGTPIEVFVLTQTNRSFVDDDSPPIHVVETRTTTEKIWTERNLLVHSKGTLDSTLAGVPKGHDEFEKTLVSLEPA